MGVFDGGVRALFGAAFGPMKHAGVLHQGTGSPIYGPGGIITGYTGSGDVDCRVSVDKATDQMRKAEGYADGDVALIILGDGLGRITSDMTVTVDRGIAALGDPITYRIESAELSAAASNWLCRGREL